MKSKFNYTMIGLIIIGLCILFIAGFFWLSVKKHDKGYQTYVVYMHEEVSGLSVQSQVRFNGVAVGYVNAIELDPNNPQLVRIALMIEDGTPITTSTVATLRSQGITGVDYIGLEAATMNAPPLKARPGEQYPVIPSRPSWFMQLSEVIPRVTKQITELSNNINKVFDDDNRQALRNSLHNIDKFSKALADNSKALRETMQALNETMANTKVASKRLPQVMDQLHSTLEAIGNTADQFAQAGKSASHTFKTGKMAIMNFSDQVLPSAQQTLQHLNAITGNLQSLTSQLNRNPSMFIRGKLPEQPGPGEK